MNLTKNRRILYALAAVPLAATGWIVAGPMAGDGTDTATASSRPSAAAAAKTARSEVSVEKAAQAAEAAKRAQAAKAAAAAQARAAAAARAKAAEAARIKAAEAARKAAAERANRSGRAAAAARAWIRPMRGDLTSGFGDRWGTAHEGVDIANGGGTPVYAAAAGVVAEARCTSPSCSHPGSLSMSGYGNKVDIEHAGGVMTRYGHLSRYVVRAGQRVRAGQLIGYEGATGNVTGPHLHFEVHVGGQAINPIPFYARKGVNLRVG
jgi:murein DD-endopeptidase MepM/ murein hydrolase activator NlpD